MVHVTALGSRRGRTVLVLSSGTPPAPINPAAKQMIAFIQAPSSALGRSG
jgi:hypothetical protein